MILRSLVLVIVVATCFLEGVVWARTSDMKQACVNCHTMHNSQGGNVISGNATTKDALLNNSCYGCHTGVNTGNNSDPRMPKVLHTSPGSPPGGPYMATGTESNHNTLAGGDFGWVFSNSLKGHNVNIPGVSQDYPRYPPGNTTKVFDSAHPLNCAGQNGCHGYLTRSGDVPAMYQTHHAEPPSPPQLRDGSSLAHSFRWLNGIAGYEDPDYELSVSSSDHNQYKGVARSQDTNEALSISHSCAGCHENFHYGSANLGVTDGTTLGTDPWIRHPVDFAMSLSPTREFANYGGTGNAYNIITPVGSDSINSVLSSVTGVGDTIVVCVSCHRAHGSPYDYSLRWDYKDWPGGSNSYNGCGDCHTEKN